MGVEVIADQADAVGLGILDLQEVLNLLRPVDGGPLCAEVDLAVTLEGCREHKDIRGAMTRIFVIFPWRLTGASGEGGAGLLDELHRLFIHANQRDLRVIGQAIGIQKVFHPGHKLAVLLGRNHPGLT